MKQVGIVGWRGMVGSVLLQRMIEENDFDDITAHFFSTSSAGAPGPVINGRSDRLKDANSLSALAEMDIIITCQGGDYTKAIYPALINHGWQGYWIDAASALRMDERACIILDPVNRENIDPESQPARSVLLMLCQRFCCLNGQRLRLTTLVFQILFQLFQLR